MSNASVITINIPHSQFALEDDEINAMAYVEDDDIPYDLGGIPTGGVVMIVVLVSGIIGALIFYLSYRQERTGSCCWENIGEEADCGKRQKEQFLVYEFATHGSLDTFLRDDTQRSKLDATSRVSIMYQLARAVNFLHQGGCHGFKGQARCRPVSRSD